MGRGVFVLDEKQFLVCHGISNNGIFLSFCYVHNASTLKSTNAHVVETQIPQKSMH